MTINPWDPAPFAAHGDKSPDLLFNAVGRALTEWELFEEHLSWIFSVLVTGRGGDLSIPAIHAYGTIVAFQGRSQMVRAAADAYQAENPNSEVIFPLLGLLSSAGDFSGRRNEIAHGIVQPFYGREAEERMQTDLEDKTPHDGYALMPASYNTKKHGLVRAQFDVPEDFLIYRQPRYAYTAEPIAEYGRWFKKLREECTNRWLAINHELWKARQRLSSR